MGDVGTGFAVFGCFLGCGLCMCCSIVCPSLVCRCAIQACYRKCKKKDEGEDADHLSHGGNMTDMTSPEPQVITRAPVRPAAERRHIVQPVPKMKVEPQLPPTYSTVDRRQHCTEDAHSEAPPSYTILPKRHHRALAGRPVADNNVYIQLGPVLRGEVPSRYSRSNTTHPTLFMTEQSRHAINDPWLNRKYTQSRCSKFSRNDY